MHAQLLELPSPSNNIHLILISDFRQRIRKLPHFCIIRIFEHIQCLWVVMDKFVRTHPDVFDGEGRVEVELFEFLIGKVLNELFVEEAVDSVLLLRASPVFVSQCEMKRCWIDPQLHDGMAPVPYHDVNTSIELITLFDRMIHASGYPDPFTAP